MNFKSLTDLILWVSRTCFLYASMFVSLCSQNGHSNGRWSRCLFMWSKSWSVVVKLRWQMIHIGERWVCICFLWVSSASLLDSCTRHSPHFSVRVPMCAFIWEKRDSNEEAWKPHSLHFLMSDRGWTPGWGCRRSIICRNSSSVTPMQGLKSSSSSLSLEVLLETFLLFILGKADLLE